VAVEVGTDEGPGQSLRLLDDGKAPDVTARDGVFSGRLDRFAEAGLTTASFSAMRRGMEGQPDFERTAEIHFAVSESRSRLTGIIRDVPRDADGDGLNEYIVFVAGVDVTDATTLQLMGTVRDSEGREVWCGGERTPLEAGSHELELLCGTEGMTGTRSQTWFVLDSLALAESKSYATLDQTAPDYRTRPYSPGELLAEAIRVVDPGKATGVDLDRDGLFDMLDVEIPIDIRFPGNYLCTGSLDCGGVELADGQVRQDLVEGRNTLRLRFPGSCIASRDAKGRYKFADIYVGYYSETGDKRPRPRAGYILGGIWLEGGPPPSQFEPTPGSSPTKSGLAQREAYDCQ
jgi:hypothetical protein